MRVHLASIGCRLNIAEIDGWARALQDRGHRIVFEPESAEVVVVNSCAVTGEAGRTSRKLVRRLRRDNPEVRILVTGCESELRPDEFEQLPGVEHVIRNADKDELVDRIDAIAPAEPSSASAHVFASRRTRGFVKVQDGCRNRCAFCVVTIARGDERSVPVDRVVAEIRALEQRGVPEVVLTGVQLGGYGSDTGSSLAVLLQSVLQRTTVPRIRLGSVEPWGLDEAFFGQWGDLRLCRHLHLPMQSGSDAVLRRMNRRCSTRRFASVVDRAREAIPDLVLTTDLMVGFPGETDEEFGQSLALVESLGFADLHVFAYSARPGTRAASLPDPVAPAVKAERSRRARALCDALGQRQLQAVLHTQRPVLWEHGGATGAVGYTDTYLRVVDPNGGADWVGKTMLVELNEVRDGRLVGRATREAARPRPAPAGEAAPRG